MRLFRRAQEVFTALLGFGVLVFLWQLVNAVWNPSPVVLPSPGATLSALGGMVRSSQFWHDVAVSLVRVMVGFVSAVVMAVPLGVALARLNVVNELLQPTLATFRSVIPFAWIPLASLWFGLAETGKYFVTWYAAFFVVVFQTEMAIRSVDRMLV